MCIRYFDARQKRVMEFSEVDPFRLEDRVISPIDNYRGHLVEMFGWLRAPKVNDGVADPKWLHVVKIIFRENLPEAATAYLM